MKKLTATRKLTISALTVAMYVAVMTATQGFAFGQFQIRIATSLYALCGIFPFLVVPLGLANFLSNALLGGLGPLDMAGGIIVGLVSGGIIAAFRNSRASVIVTFFSIWLVSGLGVPVWLSYLLHVRYWVVAASLLVGQGIAGVCGALLLMALRRRFRDESEEEGE